jgi:hypothetical protein
MRLRWLGHLVYYLLRNRQSGRDLDAVLVLPGTEQSTMILLGMLVEILLIGVEADCVGSVQAILMS